MKSIEKKLNTLKETDKGFALLMVIVVTVVLATLVVELTLSSRINAKITTNLREATKAFYLAKSGINMSLQRIKMDTAAHQMFSQYIGKTDNKSEFWWTMPLLYPLGAEMFGDLLEDSGMDKGALKGFEKKQDIGGTFMAEITDESSRLNLNDIKFSANSPNGVYVVLVNLLSTPRFNKFFRYKSREEVANRIVDWVDQNSQIAGLGGGIEDRDYYEHDYQAKNAAFFSPGELKLVKEMDDDLYSELEQFITVFPFSIPQSSVPLSKINVNTAPRELLASLFDPGVVSDAWQMSKEIEEEINQGKIFDSKNDFIKYIQDKYNFDPKDEQKPISRAVENIIGVKTDHFRIKSTGMVGEDEHVTQKTIIAVANRKGDNNILYWRVD